MLVKGTKGVTLQQDRAGEIWTLDAKVVEVRGKKVLCEVKVWQTPFGLNPDGSVNFKGSVLIELPFGPSPGVSCFSPEDPSVLNYPTMAIVPPPAEPAPVPMPSRPTANPTAKLGPIAAATAPPPIPIPAPEPVAVSPAAAPQVPASSAERILAVLNAIDARQARIEAMVTTLTSKQDVLASKQVRLEVIASTVIKALQTLDPYLEVLGAARDIAAAVPALDRYEEPKWLNNVLERFRSPMTPADLAEIEKIHPKSQEPAPVVSATEPAPPEIVAAAETPAEEGDGAITEKDMEEWNGVPMEPLVPPSEPRPKPKPVPQMVSVSRINPGDPDAPKPIPTVVEEMQRAAAEVLDGVPLPSDAPARSQTIDVEQ